MSSSWSLVEVSSLATIAASWLQMNDQGKETRILCEWDAKDVCPSLANRSMSQSHISAFQLDPMFQQFVSEYRTQRRIFY